jgi:hypothetical protein
MQCGWEEGKGGNYGEQAQPGAMTATAGEWTDFHVNPLFPHSLPRAKAKSRRSAGS